MIKLDYTIKVIYPLFIYIWYKEKGKHEIYSLFNFLIEYS